MMFKFTWKIQKPTKWIKKGLKGGRTKLRKRKNIKRKQTMMMRKKITKERRGRRRDIGITGVNGALVVWLVGKEEESVGDDA